MPPLLFPRKTRPYLSTSLLLAGLLLLPSIWGMAAAAPITTRSPQAGSTHRDIALVYITGDLGSHFGLGHTVVPRLLHNGYAVSTIDSLKAFRQRLTAHQTAALVEMAARAAMAQGHAARVVIIGHSFGADMLPPAMGELSPAIANRVAMMVLIVPSHAVYDHVALTEIMSIRKARGDALPAARRVGAIPRLCIQGEKEEDSLCPLLTSAGYERQILPGAHHLNNDAALLSTILLHRLAQLMGQ